MANFYFTFGSDERFPYQNGYLIVIAENKHEACRIFRSHYPNRPESGCLNCAFVYSEEEWNMTCMKAMRDKYPCYETIEY